MAINIKKWVDLPKEEFEQLLIERQMTREQYDKRIAAMLEDERMTAELERSGNMPTSLPPGKLSDTDSFGGI